MPDIFSAAHKHKSSHRLLSHLFNNFIENPNNISFNDQHGTERILLVLRRHWVTNLGWIMISFIFLIFPVFGVSLIELINFLPTAIPTSFILAILVFWYVATFGFILLNFLFWFYNVGIITNERVIDVDFVHLLYSEVTATTIAKIEDITDKRGGLLGVLFDYGDVFVQTAGTEANIEFMGIPKPAIVVRIISQLLPHEE